MGKITPRQQRFVDEYLIDLNGTKAAIRAGYSAKTANEQAARLMVNANIKEAVRNSMKKRAERTGVTQDYIVQTILATMDRCSQAEAVTDREGNQTGEYKFDAGNVLKGADLLGRHLGMWNDKLKVAHYGLRLEELVADDSGDE